LDVPGIARRSRLEQEHVRLDGRDRQVLDPARDDRELAGRELDLAIAQPDHEAPGQDQEQLVFALVAVPDELALELHELAVQLPDHLRAPAIGEESELLREVHLLHRTSQTMAGAPCFLGAIIASSRIVHVSRLSTSPAGARTAPRPARERRGMQRLKTRSVDRRRRALLLRAARLRAAILRLRARRTHHADTAVKRFVPDRTRGGHRASASPIAAGPPVPSTTGGPAPSFASDGIQAASEASRQGVGPRSALPNGAREAFPSFN